MMRCAAAQLEYISMVGFVFVLIMVATVIIQACLNGLPGWYSGEFAPVGFSDIGAQPARRAVAASSSKAALSARMSRCCCPAQLVREACPRAGDVPS